MSKLFGTSGIRGVVNVEIEPSLALRVGLGIATHLGNSGEVVIGRDTRVSGEMIECAVISGLLAGGCDVIKVGVVPTPVLAFGTRKLGASAGVMITASHNPPEYNGIKCWDEEGAAFTPESEEALEKKIDEAKVVEWRRIGKIREKEIALQYEEWAKDLFPLEREHEVIIDCGNGAACSVTPHLLREMGCKVTSLNSHPDGLFPGRGLEPTPEHLQDLAKIVRSTGAEVGLAHDGDADRIAAIDDRGRFVPQDKLLALISTYLVERGEIMVTTVDASRVVEDFIEKKGGKVVRTKVGDVSVAQTLRKTGGKFGGEPSGSWIFPNAHLAPDGLLSAIMILRMLDATGKRLSELVEEVPEYPILRKKIPCPQERKPEVMKNFLTRVKTELRRVSEIQTVDGVRTVFDDGSWVLVRPSGTEPYIRITSEAHERKIAEERIDMALKLLK